MVKKPKTNQVAPKTEPSTSHQLLVEDGTESTMNLDADLDGQRGKNDHLFPDERNVSEPSKKANRALCAVHEVIAEAGEELFGDKVWSYVLNQDEAGGEPVCPGGGSEVIVVGVDDPTADIDLVEAHPARSADCSGFLYLYYPLAMGTKEITRLVKKDLKALGLL